MTSEGSCCQYPHFNETAGPFTTSNKKAGSPTMALTRASAATRLSFANLQQLGSFEKLVAFRPPITRGLAFKTFRRGILRPAYRFVKEKQPRCRKHMMCPVVVANEMSGLKGRVGVGSHPHWRLKVDAVISGPSFGAGNEDQRSHYKGDQWKD